MLFTVEAMLDQTTLLFLSPLGNKPITDNGVGESFNSLPPCNAHLKGF